MYNWQLTGIDGNGLLDDDDDDDDHRHTLQ